MRAPASGPAADREHLHTMANSHVYSLAGALGLERARAIVAGALEAGHERKLMPLTVVVLDTGGHPIAAEREDGSGILRFEIARGKAHGALGIGVASGVFAARGQGRDAFLGAVAAASDGRMVPAAGGVLVLDDAGQVIGAVGVSGDTSDQDEACALAGIAAAGLQGGLEPD